MTRENKQPFGVRLRPSVRAAGEKCAEDDGRALGALMEKLLVDHLQAKGYLPRSGKEHVASKKQGARKK